jgi:hypothetical protein
MHQATRSIALPCPTLRALLALVPQTSSLLTSIEECECGSSDAFEQRTVWFASLVVGSSIVMMVEGGPRVFGVSLLTYCGLIGYLVAFGNSLWIIFSMWRSGRR